MGKLLALLFASKAFRRNRGLYTALLAALVFFGGAQAWTSYDMIRAVQGRLYRVAFPVLVNARGTVTETRANAAGQGVANGDRILAVGDEEYTGQSTLFRRLARAAPGEFVLLTVDHPARGRRTARILLAASTPRQPSPAEWVGILCYDAAVPFFCVIFGFWIVLVRPRDPMAWLLFVILYGFGQSFDTTAARWPGGVRELVLMTHHLFGFVWPAALLFFGVYYPQPLRPGWVRWLLLPPGLFLAVHALGMGLWNAGIAGSYQAVAWMHQPIAAMTAQAGWVRMFVFGGFFFALGFKQHQVENPDARRRLRILLYSAFCSQTPTFLYVLYLISSGRPITLNG
ncbi:MAG: hypothetical protein FJW40_26020, partial [Acidobacteria bacterium]|nr:hypothetical protein [Acidobacteriota bacterium]